MDSVSAKNQPANSVRIRLDELEPSRCATICQVDSADAAANQLMAMGVCVGRQVEVIKRGDPLILRVLGSRIGVSARLASRVEVKLCGDYQCSSPAV